MALPPKKPLKLALVPAPGQNKPRAASGKTSRPEEASQPWAKSWLQETNTNLYPTSISAEESVRKQEGH